MEKDDIKIAAGCQLASAVAAHCDQGHVWLFAEQAGEPPIDEACEGPAERRALQVVIV